MITYSHRRSRGPMSLTRLPLIALCWERWNERETASIPAVLGETKPAAWWKHQQQGHRERGRDHRARFVNKHELCALMMSHWRRGQRRLGILTFWVWIKNAKLSNSAFHESDWSTNSDASKERSVTSRSTITTQRILIFQARACRRPGCSRSPTSYICKFSSHLI